jgi:hypothetical protein
MSWGRSKMRKMHLAAAVLAASIATAAASADILVVRSTGPSAKNFPPGKSLPDNGRITLQANDKLVVLDGRGTRELKGPGSFTPGGPAQAASRTAGLSGIAAPQRRARIGAVRSVGLSQPKSPTIWHIDVTKSSTVCLADPANVTLWRADASQPVTLKIAGNEGANGEVSWPAGASTIEWPSGVAIKEGADYRLTWGASGQSSLKFKTLPSKPIGLEDMASSLIRNDCQAQLDLLIETVKLPDDGSTTTG